MNAKDITTGMTFTFTPTGKQFKVAKVTATRISWYTGHAHASHYSKNTMRMTWASIQQFQKGLDNGAYVVVETA